jgi:segregation and condensation protein A
MQKTIFNNRQKHKIIIQNFEGPLDLLLYLIGKNKMSIFDISLSELTDEYIKFLENMNELNLEITSEFIVMAATLLDIKARKLLPKLEPEAGEDEISEEDILARILDYKKYREISTYINAMYKENFGSFSKSFEKIKFKTNTKYEGKKLDIDELKYIYTDLLERNENKLNKKSKEIQKIALYEKVTVKDKVNQIVNYLRKNDNMVFNEIYNTNNCESIEVVTAFLGTLELSKLKQVSIQQNYLFSDINVTRNETVDFENNVKINLSEIKG